MRTNKYYPNLNKKDYMTDMLLITTTSHRLFLIVFVMLLINGCASTHVREWSSGEEIDRNFNKILIMGLVNNVSLRNDVEGELEAYSRWSSIDLNDKNVYRIGEQGYNHGLVTQLTFVLK